ncbi:hypothetical protein [Hyphomicrobium sp. NDB2Meth4]|uniref:hypothetical protein n=1 Tax=Hyphomicrobium sp. NDB2Meth4 TaxID=1892846 RepID=UPI00093014B5|nr:hypothetical protein [Hyphomicrobium sp. NDB2Meth4]
MQPLGTYDLYLNFFVAIGMPLIILANLRPSVRNSPLNAFLWRDHTNFMRTSMVIIAMLSLWSMVQLAGHYGLASAAFVDWAVLAIGIPFLVAAVAEIWFGAQFLRQCLRARFSG